MMGKTHIAGALAAWALVHPAIHGISLNSPIDMTMIAIGFGGTVISALLPDVDQPGSMFNQEVFGPLGKTRIGAMLGGIVFLIISFVLRSPDLLRQIIQSPRLLSFAQPYSTRISVVVGIIGALLIVIASLKHRGITHTLLGMGLFLWGIDTLLHLDILSFLAPWRMTLMIDFGAGYLSHLLLDLISDGVPLFYPFLKKRIRFFFSIVTDSFLDTVVVRLSLLLLFIYFQCAR